MPPLPRIGGTSPTGDILLSLSPQKGSRERRFRGDEIGHTRGPAKWPSERPRKVGDRVCLGEKILEGILGGNISGRIGPGGGGRDGRDCAGETRDWLRLYYGE